MQSLVVRCKIKYRLLFFLLLHLPGQIGAPFSTTSADDHTGAVYAYDLDELMADGDGGGGGGVDPDPLLIVEGEVRHGRKGTTTSVDLTISAKMEHWSHEEPFFFFFFNSLFRFGSRLRLLSSPSYPLPLLAVGCSRHQSGSPPSEVEPGAVYVHSDLADEAARQLVQGSQWSFLGGGDIRQAKPA